MCLSCLKQTISTRFTSTSKNKFHISNTYLTGSYSWPDCVIIAFILSSSEALASARLAVCATGNYLTHTLETHLSPRSPRQHQSSNPVKSSTTLAELAWEQLLIPNRFVLKMVWGVLMPWHDVYVPENLLEKSTLGHSNLRLCLYLTARLV